MNSPFQFRYLDDEQQDQEQPFQFRNLEEPEIESEETKFQQLRRGVQRGQARAAETVVGMPASIRDLSQMGTEFIGDSIRSLIGKEALTEEQKMEARESVKGGSLAQRAVDLLPTSTDVRQKGIEQRGLELEPQSEWEEFGDEVIEDFTALSIGGAGNFMRKLGTSVAANLGKEAVKEFGVEEGGQAATKAGIMLTMGLLGRPNADKFTKNLYKKAYDAIPEGELYDASQLVKDLAKEKAFIRKGGVVPDKQKTLSLLNQLENKVKEGAGFIEADEIPAFRRSVNSIRFGTERLSATAQKHLSDFDSILNKHLVEYGAENPTFLQNYRDANKAFAGLKESNKIGRYISSNLSKENLRPESLILLGIHSPGVLKAGIVAKGGVAGMQLMNRMTQNPVLRRHYLDTLKAAAKENKGGLLKASTRLNKEIEKEFY